MLVSVTSFSFEFFLKLPVPTSGFLCVLILISHICAPSILLPVYPENNLITPF